MSKIKKINDRFDELDKFCKKAHEAVFSLLKAESNDMDDLSYLLGSLALNCAVNSLKLCPEESRQIVMESLIADIKAHVADLKDNSQLTTNRVQ